MSDQAIAEDFDAEIDDIDDDDIGPHKRFSGKVIVLFVVLPVLLLGGGAAVIFSGMLDGDKAAQEQAHGEAAPALPQKTFFYDLPEMLVNLNSTGRRPNFLKIRVSLEVDNESEIARLELLRPRIIDSFQVYLRELRIDDLRGSAGIYRLREELLVRVNAAVSPAKIRNVLFKEVLVQ